MKLLDLVRPINDQKKRELEAQLEAEKLRFQESADRAATNFRTSVLERRWFNEHPLETSMLILLGGFCAAKWVDGQRQRRMQSAEEARKRGSGLTYS